MEENNNISLVDQYAKQRFIDSNNPEQLLAQMIAAAGVNCGHQLSDEDFDYIVANTIRVIRNLYPEWYVGDIAEAIFLGSIGRFGEIYRFTLATVCGWLKKHEGAIGCRALEMTMKKYEEEDRLRVERINDTIQKLDPAYIQEIRRGIKGWGSLYVKWIPELLKSLAPKKPTLEELCYILTQYRKKREITPPPDEYLQLIRSQQTINSQITDEIHLFINDLIKDSDNDGQADN